MSSNVNIFARAAGALALLVSLAAVGACGDDVRGELEIEARAIMGDGPALRALAGAFEKQHPAVTANFSSGTPFLSRWRGGKPPDVFLDFAGRSFLDDYAGEGAAGRLRDLSALAAEQGWERALPAGLKKYVADGRGWWMLPVGAHRSALLWFMPANLKRWGVAVPRTWEEFIAAAPALRAQGIDPLAFEAGRGTLEFFEAVAVAELGSERWEALWEGRLAPDGPELQRVWRRAKEVLDAAWGRAPAPPAGDPFLELAAGRAAFTVGSDTPPDSIDDFADTRSDAGFERAAAPGTGGIFVFFASGFALPRAAKNTPAALAWLKLLGSREGQDAYNRERGTLGLRLDSDLSGWIDYPHTSDLEFRKNRLAGSLAHGMTAGRDFTRELAAVLEVFLRDRNRETAGRAFADLAKKYGIAK